MQAEQIRLSDGEDKKLEEKRIKDDFHPECYKIHLDILTVNINNLINKLSEISNIIFDGATPVVFLRCGYTKKDLTKMLSKKITNEFYCEEVKPESCIDQNDAISVFFKENYENAFAEYINRERQTALLEIEDNIRKANDRLNERIREAKASCND